MGKGIIPCNDDSEMRWFVLLFVCATTAQAHDFWIEPSTFRPAKGEMVAVNLRVGQDFVGDPIPRSASLIDSFEVRDPAGVRPVNGYENRDPAGYFHAMQSGAMVIGYRSKPYPLELTREKFAQFLRDEGFPAAATAGPHRENFSRFAKAIVGGGAMLPKFGWRFEIVPESDPASAQPLRVRVMLDGKPLADALVTAMHRDDAKMRLTMRTDFAGRATLRLARTGVWLVKSVALIPPKAKGGEWETLWGSLTFER